MPLRRSWHQGWFSGASHHASPNYGPRPAGVCAQLAVVHSISLPPGHYRGSAVQQFFTNQLDHNAHPYFNSLQGLQVSAHFFVRRSGRLMQFVSCEQRAWHAGVSSWRGRSNCNDWSIGIELEGLEGDTFTAAQYQTLARLLALLAQRYPLKETVGHEDIAPGRKSDPGQGFDWRRLHQALGGRRPQPARRR